MYFETFCILLACGKGYYAAVTGQSTFDRTCMICPGGTYSNTDTATHCTQCPPGQATAQEGNTNKSTCQGNKISLIDFFSINQPQMKKDSSEYVTIATQWL